MWATRADAPKPSRRHQKSGRPPLRRRWTTSQREAARLTAGTWLRRMAALGHGGEQPCHLTCRCPGWRADTPRWDSAPCLFACGCTGALRLSPAARQRAAGVPLPQIQSGRRLAAPFAARGGEGGRPWGAAALDGCSWRLGARRGWGSQLAPSVARVGPGPADEILGAAVASVRWWQRGRGLGWRTSCSCGARPM